MDNGLTCRNRNFVDCHVFDPILLLYLTGQNNTQDPSRRFPICTCLVEIRRFPPIGLNVVVGINGVNPTISKIVCYMARTND